MAGGCVVLIKSGKTGAGGEIGGVAGVGIARGADEEVGAGEAEVEALLAELVAPVVEVARAAGAGAARLAPEVGCAAAGADSVRATASGTLVVAASAGGAQRAHIVVARLADARIIAGNLPILEGRAGQAAVATGSIAAGAGRIAGHAGLHSCVVVARYAHAAEVGGHRAEVGGVAGLAAAAVGASVAGVGAGGTSGSTRVVVARKTGTGAPGQRPRGGTRKAAGGIASGTGIAASPAGLVDAVVVVASRTEAKVSGPVQGAAQGAVAAQATGIARAGLAVVQAAQAGRSDVDVRGVQSIEVGNLVVPAGARAGVVAGYELAAVSR